MQSRGKQLTLLTNQSPTSNFSKLRAPESTAAQVRDDEGVTQDCDEPSAPLVLSTARHAREAPSTPITPIINMLRVIHS